MKGWWDSFQSRTLFAALATTLLLWLGWSLFTLWEAGRERSAYFDNGLKGTAQIIITSFPKALVEQRLTSNFRLAEGTATEEFNFQIWTRDRRLVSRTDSTPEQPLNPTFQTGLHTQRIGDKVWRSYSLNDADGDVHVQVGQHLAQRRSEAGTAAVEGLIDLGWLLLALVPGLVAACLWAAQPLRLLRASVAARAPTDARPLPLAGLPAEVRPLVATFNDTLARAEQARLAQQRFVADAAHELRTPLAALRLQAQLAQRARSAEERDQALARLQTGIDRSTRVAEQLLELARMDGLGAPAVAAVGLLGLGLELADASAALAARRQQRLQLDLPDAQVQSNAALLHSALRNLIDNALRYGASGGTVRLGAARQDGGWQLWVQDDGPGLSPEQRERALQPFVRLHEGDETGSGLGLAIVQRIAALLGGELRLEDAQPGLRVRLLLPQGAAPR
jgi:signal transduction histidine kinase